jgi:hypothetical protein
LTPQEREEFKVFAERIEENARRDYGQAIVTIREFYGSLTQLLRRMTHEPDVGHSFVGVGAGRILDSYHPNLRFQQVKVKRKHGR